jgi:hypothetical protein
VGDPLPGGHEVELPGPDDLLAPEAVAVQHLAGDQPGDRLQAGVRVRADVQAARLGDQLRAHVVGEAPRPHGPPADARERPAHPHGPDDRFAARGDLDAGRLDRAGLRLRGRGVGDADRTAHRRPCCGAAGALSSPNAGRNGAVMVEGDTRRRRRREEGRR